VNLSGADLTQADLTDANLAGADLTDADLTHANLIEADLTDAYLGGANLTSADLTSANLSEARAITVGQVVRARLGESTRLPQRLASDPRVQARIAAHEGEAGVVPLPATADAPTPSVP
jgi:uncharacterized protein YjbI with pentapeptide repeats